MPLLIWIVRAIVLLFLLRIVLRLLFPQPSPKRRRRSSRMGPDKPPERVGGELVRDPNCGTYIPKAGAITVGTGADVKYFCSTRCREAWAGRTIRAV